jgi:hypothetical protein
MEMVRSSTMSIHIHTTQSCISEDGNIPKFIYLAFRFCKSAVMLIF